MLMLLRHRASRSLTNHDQLRRPLQQLLGEGSLRPQVRAETSMSGIHSGTRIWPMLRATQDGSKRLHTWTESREIR